MREFAVRRAGIEPTTLVLKALMSKGGNPPDKGVYPIRI